eukprot:gb/GECG01009600.1/.p1 GENE.gb/GECG01009600.1/~~gb/GECG01009600.1/.p1  ORF type:complete len:111 (+),score=19.28 gb/GECG01009600.1/:1-333(+)
MEQYEPPPPYVHSPQETSLTVEWDQVAGATEYKLIYRAFSDSWENATELVFDGKETSTIVSGLMPTNTYQFKLVAKQDDVESKPSEVVSGDTLAADCSGSGGKKKKCIVQ